MQRSFSSSEVSEWIKSGLMYLDVFSGPGPLRWGPCHMDVTLADSLLTTSDRGPSCNPLTVITQGSTCLARAGPVQKNRVAPDNDGYSLSLRRSWSLTHPPAGPTTAFPLSCVCLVDEAKLFCYLHFHVLDVAFSPDKVTKPLCELSRG